MFPILDLLLTLKKELQFVKSGGYTDVTLRAGRSARIFEDSPSCPNYLDPLEGIPCSHCPLVGLVPLAHLSEAAPCRHIVLSASGDTVESLSRTGSQAELERTFTAWLLTTTRQIERARTMSRPRFDGSIRYFRA